jgi:hypothetical protein
MGLKRPLQWLKPACVPMSVLAGYPRHLTYRREAHNTTRVGNSPLSCIPLNLS